MSLVKFNGTEYPLEHFANILCRDNSALTVNDVVELLRGKLQSPSALPRTGGMLDHKRTAELLVMHNTIEQVRALVQEIKRFTPIYNSGVSLDTPPVPEYNSPERLAMFVAQRTDFREVMLALAQRLNCNMLTRRGGAVTEYTNDGQVYELPAPPYAFDVKRTAEQNEHVDELSRMVAYTTSFTVGDSQQPNELVFSEGGVVKFRIANLWKDTRVTITPGEDA